MGVSNLKYGATRLVAQTTLLENVLCDTAVHTLTGEEGIEPDVGMDEDRRGVLALHRREMRSGRTRQCQPLPYFEFGTTNYMCNR
ncbi:hypothetical protein M514_08868 [Trichuris suis]|uniref:Uncharacterized protein n=1 Tax=Trichuris suis TaxID=68888 RepID=A0A085LZ44_9BILA|nr:hypothetical protein M513_08868 [Trichuris suis]KFD66910.1 hypothetical protein M514_08868 [Trichuris suis]KHJ39989.1 hypothetical protein D918_09979 [Trichuris suis]